MALHNLKITVVDGGKAEGGQDWGSNLNNAANGEKKKNKWYKMLHYNQEIKGSIKSSISPTTYFALQTGVNLVAQTARQAINYYVSDIGRRHGDSNYQAIINRKIEQVTDVISLGSGALSGAAAGSIFGPVGTVIGAIAGAGSTAINIGFRQAERERGYAHEMFQDRNSRAYNTARAGYNALSGRVR